MFMGVDISREARPKICLPVAPVLLDHSREVALINQQCRYVLSEMRPAVPFTAEHLPYRVFLQYGGRDRFDVGFIHLFLRIGTRVHHLA